ncbi:MAG: phospholipid carrier-dependent glycosyltransferase, partial [Thermoanaerobaculia bacterium]
MNGRPRLLHIGAAAVLALAAAVRAPFLTSSLPYLGYVDEGHVLHPVTRLLRTGGWDPGWYLHPSLTAYLCAAAANAARPLYRFVHGRPLAADLSTGTDFYDFVTPAAVILSGRIVVLAASLAIVLLGVALARRIGGGRAGLAAGVLLALCPALVQRSSVVIVDTVAALCVLAALSVAARFSPGAENAPAATRPDATAFLAGLLSGLAAAAKYPAGAVIAAVVFTLARSGGPRSARWRLVAWSLLGTAAGAVAGTPAFVLRTRAVVAALSELSRLWANPALFTADGPGPPLLAQAFLRWELGLLLPLLGAAGAVALLVRRETRTLAAGWAAFAAVFLAPVLAHAFQPFRYALPLVPPLAIAAAVLLARGTERFGTRSTAVLSGAVAAVVLSFVPGLVTTFQVRGARDSRVTLVDWLAASPRPVPRILVIRELAILPRELARLPVPPRIIPWTEAKALAVSGTFDLVVCGRFDLAGTIPAPHEEERVAVRNFEAWLAALPITARFGSVPTPFNPLFWRSNDELLIVAR